MYATVHMIVVLRKIVAKQHEYRMVYPYRRTC